MAVSVNHVNKYFLNTFSIYDYIFLSVCFFSVFSSLFAEECGCAESWIGCIMEDTG